MISSLTNIIVSVKELLALNNIDWLQLSDWVYLGSDYKQSSYIESSILSRLYRIPLARKLQEKAKQIRQPFIELIDTIGRERCDIAWWAGQPASKNPYCSGFLPICFLSLAHDFVAPAGLERTLIVIEDDSVFRQFASNISTIQADGSAFLTLPEDANNQVAVLHNDFTNKMMKDAVAFRSAFHGDLPSIVTTDNEVVFVTYVDEGCLQEGGVFKDRYYGILPTWLERQGFTISWVPFIYQWSLPWEEAANRLCRSKYRWYPSRLFLAADDFAWCAHEAHCYFHPENSHIEYECSGIKVGGLLQQLFLHAWAGSDLLNNLTFWPFIKNLAKHNPRIKTFIIPYENHPWEKVFCRAVKEFFPYAEIIGFQHATVPLMWLLYFPGAGERASGVIPDKIVCSGKESLSLFIEHGYAASSLRLGAALRHSGIQQLLAVNSNKITDAARKNKIIVAFPIGEPDSSYLLHCVIKAFGNNSDAQVTLKPHPTFLPVERLADLLLPGQNIPSHFNIEVRSLPECLVEYDLMVFSNTSSVYEALALGLPVVSLIPETFVDLEDALHSKNVPGLRLAYNSYDLYLMSQELLKLNEGELQEHLVEGRRIVTDFFSPVTEEALKSFIPCCKAPQDPVFNQRFEIDMQFMKSLELVKASSIDELVGSAVYPQVSIIIPCYNYAHYLPETFVSVIHQTFQNFEIIIVDDGSTDNSVEVAQQLIATHPYHAVRLITMPNSGNPAFPRNRGVEESHGEYILFLDADDLIMPTMLEKSCQLLDQHPEISIASADQLYFTKDRNWVVPLAEYNFSELINNNLMPYCCLFRRKAWEDAGGVPTDTGYEDWDFWIICGTKGHYARRIPEPLTCYRQNESGRYKNELLVRDTLLRAQIVCKHPELYPPDLVDAARRHLSGYQGAEVWRDSHHAGHGIFVNIAMVTYNRLEYTRQAIEALRRRTSFPHVLTVIDNNSQDGTRVYLQELHDQGVIRNLVLLEENVGLARATNLAWSLEPEASYLMRVDNDIVIQRDGWLKEMVDVFEQTWQLGVLGYSLEPVSYPLVRLANGLSLRVKNGNVGGGCMMISRRVFNKIGYLCEEYGFYGEDDADYGARVMVSGMINAYMPDEDAAFHLPGGKAAVIDPLTLISSDGGEEALHAEYRAWKDALRQKNVLSGHFSRNLVKYVANPAACHCDSLLVEDWQAFRGRLPAPLRVAVFSLDVQEQVCYHYRVKAPFQYLAGAILPVSGIRVENNVAVELNLEAAREADIILVQRFFPCEVNREIVDYLLSLAKPVVYDIDDLLFAIPSTNPHYAWASEQSAAIKAFIECCTAVTVSTEELRQQVLPFNQQTYLLPNLLDTNLWRRDSPRNKSPIVIGYVGTNTHATDLIMLEEVLESVAHIYGNRVVFRFFGCRTERLARLPSFSFVPFEQTYVQYAEVLQNTAIDIILAPLEDTPFNRCKSNVKWLECSACGIAGIYSDLPPYSDCVEHGVTGLLVGPEPAQWVTAITLLIEQAELRLKIAQNTRRTVLDHYDLPRGCRRLLALYRQLAETVPEATDHMDAAVEAVTPLVSIIIPVYNQLEYTRNCLDRVFTTTQHLSGGVELLVVDNGSVDGTAAYLKTVKPRVNVVHHQQNLGFARGCNSGARIAQGSYLLFLNNDTEPCDGWLEAMLQVFEREQHVGITGSKLLFPDGTIQHAGVTIVEDPFLPAGLSPCHLGYLKQDAPEYNLIREFQAVTAACMMIPKDLFQQIGGFDEGYWNGFEDVDLCFRVREAGYRIIYQPSSVVIHHESKSGKERKEAERANLQRLQDRWSGRIRPEYVRVSLERVEPLAG